MPVTRASKFYIGKGTLTTLPTTWKLYPLEAPTPTERFEAIADEGIRGYPAMDYALYQGVRITEVPLSGLVYPDEVGYIIYSMLGDNLATSQPDPTGYPNTYKHVFKLSPSAIFLGFLDQLWDGTLFQEVQYFGMLANRLLLRFERATGAFNFEVTFSGAKMVFNTTDTTGGAVSDATRAPWKGYEPSVTLGGTSHGNLMSLELEFTRDVVSVYGGTDGIPSVMTQEGIRITGRATVHLADIADYKRHQAANELSFVVLFGSLTDLGAARGFEINIPKMNWLEGPVEIDRGAADVRVSWAMRAVFDDSIASPIQITLLNQQSSY